MELQPYYSCLLFLLCNAAALFIVPSSKTKDQNGFSKFSADQVWETHHFGIYLTIMARCEKTNEREFTVPFPYIIFSAIPV